jgi:hypothetical protein
VAVSCAVVGILPRPMVLGHRGGPGGAVLQLWRPLPPGRRRSIGATSDKLRDLNHDGLDDLLVGFSISDLVEGGALAASSVEGRLMGKLFDGTPIVGSDRGRS